MKRPEVEQVIREMQDVAVSARLANAVVLLQPSELTTLIVEARTQGYERGRADALRELAVEALPA